MEDLFKYGGYITDLDFNFQSGSELSSGSVTIVSKDGNYTEPVLGSFFTMPFGLNFSMVITDISYSHNGSSKVMQLELVDKSIEKLDLNLVLVRGIHTSGLKRTDKKKAVSEVSVYPLAEMPESAWPQYAKNIAKAKGDFEITDRQPALIEGTNNIWVIGGGKSVFAPTNQIIYPVAEDGFIRYKVFDPNDEQEFYLVYKERGFQGDLSETGGQNVLNKESIIQYNASDVSIEYGFTAKEFKTLLSKVGVSIRDDDNYLENTAILFDVSGTIREVLSAIASKLGFFFYYDPIRKQQNNYENPELVILGNDYINKVNQMIVDLQSSLGSEATVLSYSKTIKGVESNHVVVRGEISEKNNRREIGYSGLNNVGKSVKFKRIPVEDFFDDQDGQIKKTALDDFYSLFLSSAENEQQLFNDFVLAYYLSGMDIGEIYDNKHCKRVSSQQFKPNEVSIDPEQDDEDAEQDVASLLRKVGKRNLISFELYKNAQNDDGEPISGTKESISTPSESGLYEFFQLFYSLVFNIYISPAMPAHKAGQIAFSDGGFSVDPTPYNPNDKLKDVEPLSDFIKLIGDYAPLGGDKIGDRKISELASLAGHQPSVTLGDPLSTRVYFIGKRNNNAKTGVRERRDQEQNEEIGKKVDRLIDENIVTASYDGKALLICDKDYNNNLITPIKELSERLWTEFRKDKKNALRINYQRVNDEDKSFQFDFDESSFVLPTRSSINHVTDNRSKVLDGISKSNLVFLNGPKKETDLFYKNIANGDNFNSLVPVIKGPLRSLEVRYFRSPLPSDVDPEKGMDSFSVSVGSNGISTTIRYSTRKLFPIDQETIITEDRRIRNVASKNIFSARQKNSMRL